MTLKDLTSKANSEPKAGFYVCIFSIRQIVNTKGSYKEIRKQKTTCIYLYTNSLRSYRRKKMSKNKLALIITFKSPHSLLRLRKHSREGSTFAVINSTNYIRRDLNHILKSSKSHNRVSQNYF